MSIGWAWLALGVLAQWACVASLRMSDGFRRPAWALITVTALSSSTGAVAISLTHGLTVAVAYGIWTGAGIILAGATGALVFGDRMTRAQLGGMLLVLIGLAVLYAGSAADT